jgi:hypothetical protein
MLKFVFIAIKITAINTISYDTEYLLCPLKEQQGRFKEVSTKPNKYSYISSQFTHISYLRNRPWRPLSCEMLRIPHCLDNRLKDGGEVVCLKHRSL